MRTKLLLSAALVAMMGVAAIPANAENVNSATKTPKVIADMKPVSTTDFVKKASMGDMYEIQASEVVMSVTGTSDPAREFAQQTIKAHTDIAADLKETLGGAKANVAPATSLDAELTGKVNALKAIKDPAMLSDEYLKQMSMFHDKAQALYENYSVNGDNEAVKAFAMEKAPVVKAHNDHLKGLEISK